MDADKVDADRVWERIVNHSSDVFHLKGGKEFTYEARERTIYLHTVNRVISRTAIERALRRVPLATTSAVRDLSAPSYVYAVLADPRISAGNW